MKIFKCNWVASAWLIAALFWLAIPLSYADDRASSKLKHVLFDNLYSATSALEGQLAEDAIWQFWFDQSPSAEVRISLDAGMERRLAYDFEAAEQLLDVVVESAPSYAEGYNQRAFVRFLRENYDGALSDLEAALSIEPKHFGAMSGLFHVLLRQNRQKAAYDMLQQAVDVHPWLKERSSLPKELWTDRYRAIHQPGQEI